MPNLNKKEDKKPWKADNVRPAQGRRKVNDYAFYNSTAWRKLALRHKAKNPLCVQCLQEGITVPVDVTDHIKRVSKFWELRFDWDNLQSLCHTCHNRKSGKEAHQKKGK